MRTSARIGQFFSSMTLRATRPSIPRSGQHDRVGREACTAARPRGPQEPPPDSVDDPLRNRSAWEVNSSR
jgi:hypothetical protein